MSEPQTSLQHIEAKLDEILKALPNKENTNKEIIAPTFEAELRADFMRRWFAIAISVGFASTVVDADWLKAGRLPNQFEQAQFFRLGVALIATLFSWEGYFKSIKTKPLNDSPRYYIDVFLVFLYLTLLVTSARPEYWLLLHAGTFGVYFLWDSLTIVSYGAIFEKSASEKNTPTSIVKRWLKIYFIAPFKSAETARGPFITVIWGMYFIFIWRNLPTISSIDASTFTVGDKWITAISSVYVLYGVILYRENKGRFRGNLWFPWAWTAVGLASLYLINYLRLFEAIAVRFNS